MLSIFPASSVKAVSVLLTVAQASINSLRAAGVDVQPQLEDTADNLQGLVRHLEEKSREGSLRQDRDTYAFLSTQADNPGKFIVLVCLMRFHRKSVGMFVKQLSKIFRDIK